MVKKKTIKKKLDIAKIKKMSLKQAKTFRKWTKESSDILLKYFGHTSETIKTALKESQNRIDYLKEKAKKKK